MQDPFSTPSLFRSSSLGNQEEPSMDQPQIETRDTSIFKDLIMAPLRGAEGFVKSIWDLGDMLTGDLLWDYNGGNGRILGKSETLAGGLLEGVVQFGLGWGTSGVALKALGGFKSLGALKALPEAARKAQGLKGIAANAAMGSVTDLIAFEGNEGRLADLFAQYETMTDTPILGDYLEFMQSTEDDSEIVGRLKNTLEGLGIGVGVDLMLSASRALRNTKNGNIRHADYSEVDHQKALTQENIDVTDIDRQLKATRRARVKDRVYYGDHKKATKAMLEEDYLDTPQEGVVKKEYGAYGKSIKASELTERFPEWGSVTQQGGNPTQRANTENTMKKLAEFVGPGEGKKALDVSAGMGINVRALDEAGYKVETTEPFPPEGFTPTYKDTKDIPGHNQYDLITNTLVINVVPQDIRDNIISDIGRLLNVDGTAIVTTRSKTDVMKASSTASNTVLSDTEVYIKRSEQYQKGFTKQELKSYVQEVLDSEYGPDVFTVSSKGKESGLTGVTPEAVVIKKNAPTGEGTQAAKATAASPKKTKININGEVRTSSVDNAENLAQVMSDTSLIQQVRKGGDAKAQVDDALKQYVGKAFGSVGRYAAGSFKRPKKAQKAGKAYRALELEDEITTNIRNLMNQVTNSEDMAYVASVLGEQVDEFFNSLKANYPDVATRKGILKEFYEEKVSKEFVEFSTLNDGSARFTFEDAAKALEEANEDAFRNMTKQEVMRGIMADRVAYAHELSGKLVRMIDAEDPNLSDFFEEFAAATEQAFDATRLMNDAFYGRGLGLRLVRENPLDYKVYNLERVRSAQKMDRTTAEWKGITKDRERLVKLAKDLSKLDPSDPKLMQKAALGIKESNTGRNWDTWKAYFKNNLLWNPATQLVNFFSTVGKFHLEASSRYIGGRFGQARLAGSNPELARIAAAQAEAAVLELRTFWTSWDIALKHFKTAWNQGGRGGFFENGATKLEGYSYADIREVRDLEKTIQRSGGDIRNHLKALKDGTLNVILPIHTLPGRLMGSVDEGMKVLTYDSSLLSDFYVKGISQGMDKEQAIRFAKENFERGKIAGSRMVSSKGYKEYAQETARKEIFDKYKLQDGDVLTRDQLIEYSDRAREIYAKENPQAQATLKAQQIKIAEAAKELPPGSYNDFIQSEEYLDADWLFQAAENAQRKALDNAYQSKLGDNAFAQIAKSVQKISQRDTLGGALMSTAVPFVSTPYNVMAHAFDTGIGASGRLTLGVIKERQAYLKRTFDKGLESTNPADQAKAVEAIGRAGIGTMLATTASLAAYSGVITGGRPRNPGEAALWDAEGIQEYSFKVGDTYISYARMEPLATIFGIVGDLANMDNLTKDEETDIHVALSVALASNVTDKTFLTSISTVLDALSSGEENKINRAVNALVSPVFANPGIAAVNRNLFDEGTVRETRTLLDAIQGKTPGAAETVDPRRNILGEVVKRQHPALSGGASAFGLVNPTYLSKRKNDPIFNEMLSLNKIPEAPSPRMGDLDLRELPSSTGKTSAFDERNELIGTVQLGGLTLRERLTQLINSDRYKKYASMGPIEGDFEDPRYLMIQSTISAYRSRANYELQKTNPQIGELMKRSRVLQQQVSRGALSTVDASNILFQ